MNTINEEWRPVDGYENYEVSNFGRVKSLNYHRTGKERIMKPENDKDGYLAVNLYRNGQRKMFKVHRLVATAFLPNPFGFPEINHLDEDKTNNEKSNIEWCSRRYNTNYGSRTKRQAASRSKAVEASKFPDFSEICLRFSSTAEAGRNDYNAGAVSDCCNGCYCSKGNFYKNLYWRFAV